jgi:hypothetical protein
MASKYTEFSIIILDEWLISGYRFVLRRDITNNLADESAKQQEMIELIPYLKEPTEKSETDLTLPIRHDELWSAAEQNATRKSYW